MISNLRSKTAQSVNLNENLAKVYRSNPSLQYIKQTTDNIRSSHRPKGTSLVNSTHYDTEYSGSCNVQRESKYRARQTELDHSHFNEIKDISMFNPKLNLGGFSTTRAKPRKHKKSKKPSKAKK